RNQTFSNADDYQDKSRCAKRYRTPQLSKSLPHFLFNKFYREKAAAILDHSWKCMTSSLACSGLRQSAAHFHGLLWILTASWGLLGKSSQHLAGDASSCGERIEDKPDQDFTAPLQVKIQPWGIAYRHISAAPVLPKAIMLLYFLNVSYFAGYSSTPL
ncbi:hypothetical protein ANANG_G00173020, partial [Anguilla anguilla]